MRCTIVAPCAQETGTRALALPWLRVWACHGTGQPWLPQTLPRPQAQEWGHSQFSLLISKGLHIMAILTVCTVCYPGRRCQRAVSMAIRAALPLALPEFGCCASSGRAWQLWAGSQLPAPSLAYGMGAGHRLGRAHI